MMQQTVCSLSILTLLQFYRTNYNSTHVTPAFFKARRNQNSEITECELKLKKIYFLTRIFDDK